MIKTIEDVFDEAFAAYECRHPDGWDVPYQKILKEWAISIIDETRQEICERISDREWEDMDKGVETVKKKFK